MIIMLKQIIFSIISLTLIACQSSLNQNFKQQTIDSLKMEIQALKEKVNLIDSQKVRETDNKHLDIPKLKDSIKTSSKPIKSKIEKKPIKKNTTKLNNDTIYHYFSNRKVSVKICPRINEKQWILVFSNTGKETIRFESVIQSYSVTYDLKFRQNGSLETVLESTNPGASMYWYKCNMTFNEQNEPLWKVCQEYPITRLEHPDKNKYYWDKKSMNWVKQEIVVEQETPKH
jgi:hypothetical protein